MIELQNTDITLKSLECRLLSLGLGLRINTFFCGKKESKIQSRIDINLSKIQNCLKSNGVWSNPF